MLNDPIDLDEPIDIFNPVNRDSPLNDDLRAWYKCLPGLDAGPTLTDIAKFNPATLTNMGAGSGWGGSPAPGGLAGSMRFDGSNDYLSAGDAAMPTGANPVTVSCWVYLTANQQQEFVAWGRPGNATGASFHQMFVVGTIAGPKLFVSNYGNSVSSASNLSLNTWYYCTFVSDGANVTIYLNGVVNVSSTAMANGFATTLNGHLTLGCRWDADSAQTDFTAGRLDSIRIYSRARSAVECWNEYQDERAGCPETINRLGGLTAAQRAYLRYISAQAC